MSRRIRQEPASYFALISKRYENKSLLITCNQPFTKVDKEIAIAAMNRLADHPTILELYTQSYSKGTPLARNRRLTQRKERIQPTDDLKTEGAASYSVKSSRGTTVPHPQKKTNEAIIWCAGKKRYLSNHSCLNFDRDQPTKIIDAKHCKT
ncbi:MAG: ATP-binding protein [Chlamydiia bacterium]